MNEILAAEAQNVDQPDLEVEHHPRWMVVVVLRNVDLVAAFANVRVNRHEGMRDSES